MRDRTHERTIARLRTAAEQEVLTVARSLPSPVRAKALTLPVTYEAYPSRELVEDGLEVDILGLFVGTPFPDQLAVGNDVPAQIILFLDNLWEFAGRDAAIFREEVRKTYLHELGHYLGLDEDDLADRDLD